MDILYLLVPLSVVLAAVIGAMFWHAVATGQFDDLGQQGDLPDDALAADRPLAAANRKIPTPGS